VSSVPFQPSSSPPGLAAGWEIHHRTGTVAHLHGLDLLGVATTTAHTDSLTLPTALHRGVWLLEPIAPAVALGSAQRFAGAGTPVHGIDAHGIDAHGTDAHGTDAHGIEVVVRRSGGGAVMLEPGISLWMDVVLPRHDPLWDDDVSRSAHWLGQAWVQALASLGVVAAVHDGPTDRHALARAACFAGLGAGEVVHGGRKLVGISQRRTRDGARFQCVAYTATPNTDLLVDVLADVVGDGLATADLAEVLANTTGVIPVESRVLADAVCCAIMEAVPVRLTLP
jgi:lipoate-protein ligase A